MLEEAHLAAGWQGRLALGFELRGERTVLARREHRGPLGVQRPFYEREDPGTCQVYLLHPPGGLVGGDDLSIDVQLGPGARALLTTPAATKLYRSQGATAAQRVQLRAAQGARIEWLPQETIAYDGARAALATRVELAQDAELIAWEVTCLGRPACQERFAHGALDQRLEVSRAGTPLMPLVLERARYRGGAAGMDGAWGLGGHAVSGTLLCVTAHDPEPLLPELRALLAARAGEEAVCSRLAHALCCRYLGPSTERALSAFRAAWGLLRQRCFALPAAAPRIWAT
ncbi:MAG TPA: urease accessory protein UreD [Polyangiales bacterium]|nr:urease accessory protein UreD [Polyangiales bacterium]